MLNLVILLILTTKGENFSELTAARDSAKRSLSNIDFDAVNRSIFDLLGVMWRSPETDWDKPELAWCRIESVVSAWKEDLKCLIIFDTSKSFKILYVSKIFQEF